MQRVELGPWTLRGPDVVVPATVPGCVHTDLLAAGLIPDPVIDDNESAVDWVGRSTWTYSCHWTGEVSTDRTELVFEGLDTVAEVRVNGETVEVADDMHVMYEPEVTLTGDDLIEVRFTPPRAYAAQQQERLGDLPCAYPEPYNFIRKMACNFGWDWGPTVVTSGIWRPAYLRIWERARFSSVIPQVTVDPAGDGEVRLSVDIAGDTDAPRTVEAEVAGVRERVAVPAGQGRADVVVRVGEPELWWPRGYGDQPLYDLTVRLSDDGGVLDEMTQRIGFRTIELDTSPDEEGSRFTIRVNGRDVWVRGVNWIPEDIFPSRMTPQRYRDRLSDAIEANANLVRVWGGGIYEDDAFYEFCDEQGLLVWQDFLFACAAYPEEEPFASLVHREAEGAIERLAWRPSLVLWNGNNENLMGWFDWGWQDEIGDRTWGRGFYTDLLPEIVGRLDPTRPYLVGSPYSGSMDINPSDDRFGVSHIWDVWNQLDYEAYRDHRPRFAAEFGFQGPATIATLQSGTADAELSRESAGVAGHQKAMDGEVKLDRSFVQHFGAGVLERVDFQGWHYLTQVNQARAFRVGVEHFRALQPHCSGTIIWQLNDCWPASTWAVVDSGGRRKPAWFALRNAYADRLATIQPDDGLTLVLVNDGDDVWEATAAIGRYTFDGTAVATADEPVVVPPRGVVRLDLSDAIAVPDAGGGEFVRAEVDGSRADWFFRPDRELAMTAAVMRTAVTPSDDGVIVTVTAETFVRDLSLLADVVDPDATVDGAMYTLLPGESARFRVRTEAASADWATALRCVNQIVHQ